MIVCGTGHRPEGCVSERDVRFKVNCYLTETKPDVFITGMASGFDLWAAQEAMLHNIEVWAAKPWAGHKHRAGEKRLYDTILAYASRVINVNEAVGYPGPYVYHVRNQWMVDNADSVVAYWNGESSGGTYACMSYAINAAKKPVLNIYDYPPF